MITNIIEKLSQIEADNEQNGMETFACVNHDDNGELEIRLNAAAAIGLCRRVLNLVEDNIDGNHSHFDEASFVDEGDGKFIITFINDSSPPHP